MIRVRKKKIRDPDRKPAKGVYILPNALTLCGMFFGFYAIISAINGKFIYAAWAIILANIFDGLDGWVARLTRTTTRFGVELDSLSDLVAFGVAPSILIYKWALFDFGRVGFAIAFLFAACGALRLARFNIQSGGGIKSFKGLPIPGAATMIAATVIFCQDILNFTPQKNIFFPALTFLLSFMMVSNLKFHGLKEVDFKEKKPFWILLFFILLIFFIVIHPQIAIFTLASIYVLSGIIENIIILIKKRKQKPEVQDEKNKNI
ncbi:CDP-diacylglycerol--serine O-phosphatidyltransferase [Thermodesulfovibrio yellowstonii]|uniref:CDP-diacylglycerol--serine O-phosphatidyltransferase n=1 Tax=Thermodesulfovibrio yellowstonii TaxID=28262 RepID=A0A9W6GHF7_9BACT|nr:CDP-diacylglycerol--serine O-phosphatidyltransferase [Thermodesulfovibrio islandicus]